MLKRKLQRSNSLQYAVNVRRNLAATCASHGGSFIEPCRLYSCARRLIYEYDYTLASVLKSTYDSTNTAERHNFQLTRR